ncbi:MAG: prolipoprotein diacylglyceryl transferase [Rhodospirillales bacterium]|nr:prolipoprotein diacylglyceryl transferase [Alphaproteobacteria bacterium]MBL6929084.1 prolipoprotein diacylglyceryl transferase [Rhodospirillales bacterium]
MTFVIPFPMIDPIMFEVGPIAVRWYGLAYVVGLVLAWRYVRRLAGGPPEVARLQDVDDFLVWATLGVIIGGRLGYALFYQPAYFLANPGAIVQTWTGGMSFHGGLLGVVVAGIIFVRRRKIDALAFGDMLACAAPIGLFLGRVANFVNSELWGRPTDVAWAVVFPNGGPQPRHPSQIYEASLEGVVLFAVLFILWRIPAVRDRPGTLIGVFLTGYSAARAFVELFRQPDAHIGFLLGGTTMGQWLSVPMLAVGLWFIFLGQRRS